MFEIKTKTNQTDLFFWTQNQNKSNRFVFLNSILKQIKPICFFELKTKTNQTQTQFTPTPLHHQQIITCRATNYKLQGTNNVMEDHRVLDVFCEYLLSAIYFSQNQYPFWWKIINNISVAPHVELNLGPAVNPRDLEEGDDVYFECHIQAHPPAYKVTWRHKGRWQLPQSFVLTILTFRIKRNIQDLEMAS